MILGPWKKTEEQKLRTPCYKCRDKSIGCRNNCTKSNYLKYIEDQKKIREEKEKERMINGVVINGIERSKKR